MLADNQRNVIIKSSRRVRAHICITKGYGGEIFTVYTLKYSNLKASKDRTITNVYFQFQILGSGNESDEIHVMGKSGTEGAVGQILPLPHACIPAGKPINIADYAGVNTEGSHGGVTGARCWLTKQWETGNNGKNRQQ